ncbi:hypothetical protein ISCGN_001844 [Ixodes scapularis]
MLPYLSSTANYARNKPGMSKKSQGARYSAWMSYTHPKRFRNGPRWTSEARPKWVKTRLQKVKSKRRTGRHTFSCSHIFASPVLKGFHGKSDGCILSTLLFLAISCLPTQPAK